MKNLAFLSLMLFFNLSAYAASVVCVSGDHRIFLETVSKNEIKVNFDGESAIADGILSSEEIDLVAKFSTLGEMTLFAKIGISHPNNYIFIKGKRFSVNCR